MKKIIFLPLILLSIICLVGQHNTIIVETDNFDFLIGKEYVEVSELGDFERGGGGWTTEVDGFMHGYSSIQHGPYTILSIEHRFMSNQNEQGTPHRKKILNIVVLDGAYSKCSNCLLPCSPEARIITIHPRFQPMNRDNILKAFLVDIKSGEVEVVDPDFHPSNSIFR